MEICYENKNCYDSFFGILWHYNPADIYMFKMNNRNTEQRVTKLTIKTPEQGRHQALPPGNGLTKGFTRKLCFLKTDYYSRVSTVTFVHVIAGWVEL